MNSYPSQSEVTKMVREEPVPESMAVARIALRLGLAWAEINEILVYGEVSDRTINFWNMVRANA